MQGKKAEEKRKKGTKILIDKNIDNKKNMSKKAQYNTI